MRQKSVPVREPAEQVLKEQHAPFPRPNRFAYSRAGRADSGTGKIIVPMKVLTRAVLLVAIFSTSATGALAASCQKEPTFDAWLDGVRAEAKADGVSARAISQALAGVHFDPAIVKKDRAQGVFTQDFLQFSDRMVAGYRISQGKANITKLKNTFARIEQQFGVPAPVLTAFWGLETDFGAFNGDGRYADLAGDACLRLPAARSLPPAASLRDQDHRPRRSFRRRNARTVGG